MKHPKLTPLSITSASLMAGLSERDVTRLIEVGVLAAYRPLRGNIVVERESLLRLTWTYMPANEAAVECRVSVEEVDAFVRSGQLTGFDLDSGTLIFDVVKLKSLVIHAAESRRRAEQKALVAAEREKAKQVAQERLQQKLLRARAQPAAPQRKRRKVKKKKRRNQLPAIWTGQTRKRGSHRGPW